MFQAFVLGIIQGLTEFIPVSSSGHLVIIQELFHWDEYPTSFDIVIHGGTLLALLLTFYKKISSILLSIKEKSSQKLIFNITVASIPVVIIGFFCQDLINTRLKSLSVITFMLITIGIIMLLADFYIQKHRLSKKGRDIDFSKASIIGISQSLSLIRGTSRSGISIIAGVFQKISLKDATEFSFLISIPVIALLFLYNFGHLLTNGTDGVPIEQMLIGFVVSFVSGFIAINFMLLTIQKLGLKWFGLYRIILGIVIFIIL